MRQAIGPCRAGIALALSLLASAALSAEPLTWVADPDSAAERARATGRLLLVLHLSGDFTADTPRQRPLVIYQSIALADDKVREVLDERFVLTFRHVGPPAVLIAEQPARGKARSKPPSDEFAIAYVCLPDGRVVHFLPGFVSSRELLSELAFAADCHADFSRFPAEEQAAAARQAHLAAASKRGSEQFGKLISTRWSGKDSPRTSAAGDLRETLRAARQIRDERLREQLGSNWTAAEFPMVATALAAHGGAGGDEIHLAMAAHPLVPLEDLAGEVYSKWSGQRFWKKSPLQAEVARWIEEYGGKGRPLLLVIDAEEAPGSNRTKDSLAWPIKASVPLPNRDDFFVRELSLDELADWLTDKGLGPLAHPPGQMVRYVVFDRSGQLVATVNSGDGVSRLAAAMNAASRTGETAVLKLRSDE